MEGEAVVAAGRLCTTDRTTAAFAESRRAAFRGSCWMRTTGQLPPLDDSAKRSSERLLNSETCRKPNSYNSAKAVGQQETVV